jgi:hypothetical protein
MCRKSGGLCHAEIKDWAAPTVTVELVFESCKSLAAGSRLLDLTEPPRQGTLRPLAAPVDRL